MLIRMIHIETSGHRMTDGHGAFVIATDSAARLRRKRAGGNSGKNFTEGYDILKSAGESQPCVERFQ